MRIIHMISSRIWGGSEVYVLSLCKEQREAGHDVEIICAGNSVVKDGFEAEGFKVRTMTMHGHLNFMTSYRLAASLFNDRKKTVVHVHKFSDAFLAVKAKKLSHSQDHVRVVCTVHLIEPADTSARYKRLYDGLDAMIFISRIALRGFLSTNPPVNRNKLHVVYNSIKPSVVNNVVKKNSRPVEILYLGRLLKEKGVDTLIESLMLVPDASLKICGTGEESYCNYLKQLAVKIGVEDRITWLGFSENVYMYIALADIGVVPSRWQEPFGLVLLEFMSQGVPVVTTDNGAQPEIITDGSDGLLVEPDNSSAFAKAIKKLVDDYDLRMRIGEKGRQTYRQKFSYDKFYREVMSVYEGS